MLHQTSIHSYKTLPSVIDGSSENKQLARSDYQLPLCWLLLFQEQDLQLQRVHSSTGEKTCEYTTLISAKDVALARYQQASERFKSLLGRRCETYFDYWFQYLDYNAEEYIYLDASALWMNGDEQAYLENLRLSISGIEWVMSDQCRWQRSPLASLPMLGRLLDPIEPALKQNGVRHLLMQSGVLDISGDIYIDKKVLQGDV